MDQFHPPVKDMIFALREVVGRNDLQSNSGFADFDREFLETIYDSAAEVASEIIAPTNKDGDRVGVSIADGRVTVPKGYAEAYDAYVDGGWSTLSCNPEYGGQGMPALISMPVNEMVMGANFSWAHLALLTNSAIRAVDAHASQELKDLYLEKLISGKFTGTMNLTEPQAGSDLSVMNTIAQPNGDHYKITGQKIFITWGEHDLSENIVHLVLARLPNAPDGVKGISLFLVPKVKLNKDGSLGERNTLKAVSVEHKLGIHGCATCVMSFEEAEGFLIGEPNQGLACMFTMMNDARIGVACESVAIAERAYQQAVHYAKDRVQGSTHISNSRVTIINHPDVRRMILSMKSLIEIMRVLVYENTFECDLAESKPEHGKRADLLTPITKAWCSELCQDITSIALQVHGGMGYVEETGAAQHFRDARITTIYEGTTGIQANDLIGRKFIGDNGSGMNDLLNEIEKEIEVADIDTEMRDALNQAIGHARNVSSFILENYQKEPNLPGACSHNFLMMMGYLVGGWIAVRNITASKDALEESDDSQFYNAKIISSNFYIEQFLPLVSSFGSSAMHGSESMMSMPDEQF